MIVGDGGIDVADYSAMTGVVTVTLDGVANDGVGEGDNVDADVIRGGKAADSLTGGPGDERLIGGQGADQLRGGDGSDALVGGQGADLLDGEGGTDVADYSAATLGVTVTLDATANDGYAGENDDARVENVIGGDFADVLTGDGGPNALFGGEGGDQVGGGAGDDLVVGGAGADALSSGAGIDTILARDGESDSLTCDVAGGKTVEADAIDKATVCDISAAGGPEPTPIVGVDTLIPAPPPVPLGRAGGDTPASLLASLTGQPRRNAKLRVPGGGVIDLGELNCPGCTAKAVVRAGKAMVAKGAAKGGAGPTALTAALTQSGAAMLGRGPLAVVATIVVKKGKVRGTTVLPLRLRGRKVMTRRIAIAAALAFVALAVPASASAAVTQLGNSPLEGVRRPLRAPAAAASPASRWRWTTPRSATSTSARTWSAPGRR